MNQNRKGSEKQTTKIQKKNGINQTYLFHLWLMTRRTLQYSARDSDQMIIPYHQAAILCFDGVAFHLIVVHQKIPSN
jgi:hypothetical protein